MLIVCPNCKKRFNLDIDPAAMTEDKKLRCSSCRAVFRLVRKAPASQPGQAPEERQAPPSRLKVVIANESAAFCEAVRKVLAPEPFELFVCNDGKVALETVQRVRPEVLLLDVALPTMFGFEVCERVRQDPDLSGVKIVLIASIYDKTRYKRSPNSLYGADDYIEKHHIPDQLVPMIYRLASVTAPMEKPTARELAAQEDSRSELRDVEVRETSAEPTPAPAPPAAPPAAEAPAPHVQQAPVSPAAAPVVPSAQQAPPAAPADPWLAQQSAASEQADPWLAQQSAASEQADPWSAQQSEASQEDPWLEQQAAAVSPIPAAPESEAPAAAQAAPQPAAAAAELPETHVKARRLARIIVSDIVLYNQGKVEQGVRDGSFYDLLADDIREGERLYRQRVPDEVRETTTFLKDAFEDLIAKKRAELRV